MAGAVGLGGSHPVRIQSMTTSDTQDAAATVRECIALAEAGCEIVRVTAPNVQAARCLRAIRREFSAAGFAGIPLVADVHFLPAAAMEAVEHVEKVRVNPGNYADKKRFAVRDYSDADYARELERLHEAFSPLVRRCRELGRALRIGTNHGSLSDRIMNRYGDSPLGMVESALEFIRIAEAGGFHGLVLSMKASNPKVMIQACRLLAARMDAAGMPYPLHLGVTEAGDGEDGRIKSAIGIGSLLLDGIGDTIRVSLTEDSVHEIPVARALADRAMALWAQPAAPAAEAADTTDPFHFTRRQVTPIDLGPGAPVGPEHPPRVIADAGPVPPAGGLAALAARLRAASPRSKDTPIEGLLVRAADAEAAHRAAGLLPLLAGEVPCLIVALPGLAALRGFPTLPQDREPAIPRLALALDFGPGQAGELEAFLRDAPACGALPVVGLPGTPAALAPEGGLLPVLARAATPFVATLAMPPIGAAFDGHAVGAWRRLAAAFHRHGIMAPLWIRATAASAIRHDPAFLDRLLEAGMLAGSLLADGLGDLLSIETEPDLGRATTLAYNVLQGAGARVSKTEFVACPSCGRTLFDLQSTTRRIREKTGHLKGVKIAIMGCIVNGPGEMADADFGYVGGAPGRINLYVGKDCVQHHLPTAEADERLIELIKAHGKWIDPAATPPA
jgi:(E)-4-hydroxy-3-methylbut-2-enyl-diphosphate synthase